MRARLKIERQVEKLAASLTPEIVSRVINRLEQPEDKFTGWECRCIFCEIQGAYTLNKRMQHINKDDEESIRFYDFNIEVLKNGKRLLKSIDLSFKAKLHIKNAEHQIGIMPLDLLTSLFDKFLSYYSVTELEERALRIFSSNRPKFPFYEGVEPLETFYYQEGVIIREKKTSYREKCGDTDEYNDPTSRQFGFV